jgi:hypothetical protein
MIDSLERWYTHIIVKPLALMLQSEPDVSKDDKDLET